MTDERRSTAVGNPMLVQLPDAEAGYRDSGEGGLAFFLLVKSDRRRQACLAGQIHWPLQDVVVNDRWPWGEQAIDAGLLIGSTGQSLFHDEHGYFHPEFDDLTADGQQLYLTLSVIYGAPPALVTLLDET